MKNLARVASVLGGLVALSGGAAVIMVGCSDDDVGVATTDAGEDGKADVAADVGADTSPVKDSGADAADVIVPPKFDAGPPNLLTYAHQVNKLFCQKLAFCCGNPSGFDVEACTTSYDTTGTGFGGVDLLNAVADGGNVAFDPSKAATCFSEVNALGCGAISSATWVAAERDCRAGIVGTIAAGNTGCKASGECVPNAHCVIANDAGTCTAPGALGSSCANPDYFKAHEQCGYLYSGVPRYCDTQYNFPGTGATDTCKDQKALNASCYDSMECLSGVCDYVSADAAAPGACSATLSTFLNPGVCKAFTIVDAGGGG
jgi:hypothetical protein